MKALVPAMKEFLFVNATLEEEIQKSSLNIITNFGSIGSYFTTTIKLSGGCNFGCENNERKTNCGGSNN